MKFVTSMICVLLVITRVSGQSVTPPADTTTTAAPTAAAPAEVNLTNTNSQNTAVYASNAHLGTTYTSDMADQSSADFINTANGVCKAVNKVAIANAKVECVATNINQVNSIIVEYYVYIMSNASITLTTADLQSKLTTALNITLPLLSPVGVVAKGALVFTGLPKTMPTDKELIEVNYMAVVAHGTYTASYSDSSSAAYTTHLQALAKKSGYGYKLITTHKAEALVLHTFSIPASGGTTSMNQTVYLLKVQSVTVTQMEKYCKIGLTAGTFTVRSCTISSIREHDSSGAKAICSPLLIISALILCVRSWITNVLG